MCCCLSETRKGPIEPEKLQTNFPFVSPLQTVRAPDTEPPVSHYRTCPYSRAGWLPPRQSRKSCTAQMLNFTRHIEDGFEKGEIADIVLVYLSAAYDTVDHRRLFEKFYDMTREHRPMSMINTLLENRRFFVELGGKRRDGDHRETAYRRGVSSHHFSSTYTQTTSLFTRARVALCMQTTLLSPHRARTLLLSRKH